MNKSKEPVNSVNALCSSAVVCALLIAVSARELVTSKTSSAELKYVLDLATSIRFDVDFALTPLPFLAITLKVYDEPGLNPLTTQVVVFVVQDFADGFDVTTYSRMGVAPLDAGRDHFTLIDVAIPLAWTDRGADGLRVTAPTGDATRPVATSDTSAAANTTPWRQTRRFINQLLSFFQGNHRISRLFPQWRYIRHR
jgi:hypothetical protein